MSKKLHEEKIANQQMAKQIQTMAQENLLTNIESKAKEVSEYIAENFKYDDNIKGLTSAHIFNVIANRSITDIASTYAKSFTPQELAIGLNIYIKMIGEINKYVSMPPSKASFCLLMGISNVTYNSYLVDPERSDIMNMVETYITGSKLASAQLGELKEISTIFDLKSQHGFVEAQAPTTIIHERKADVEDIRSRLAEMKKGRVTEANYEEK